VLGNLPWYSTLIFELATRGLPLHRQLWEERLRTMALASVVLIADSLGAWCRVAASIAGARLCSSAPLLSLLFVLDDHSTWFTIAPSRLVGPVILERVKPGSRALVRPVCRGVVVAFVTGERRIRPPLW
jgi:hypothetical protein